MSFKTASAILRGRWLLDKQWADAHMPLVMLMLQGKAVDFGIEKDISVEPRKVLSHKSLSVYAVNYNSDLSMIPSGSVAMMDISGPMTKYGDLCAYGSLDYAATLDRLKAAPNIKGVIIKSDTPGGEASGIATLDDSVKSLASAKPVITVVNDGIVASAGVWGLSGSTEFYTSQKTDQVGSIGVYTTIADFYKYYEAQGLPVRDIYAPGSEEKNLDYREALKGNDEPMKADLKVLRDEFISVVSKNRAGKIQGTDWQTGKMFYSKEAAKIGLTDGQKSFEQVVRRMDNLIKQKEQSNSNTMAFEKTLAVAKATEFAVTDEGFALEEAHLNNIEAALAAAEITAASLATSNEAFAAASDAKIAAEASLATANEEIVSLKAQVATLGKKDAKTASSANADQDPKDGASGWDKYATEVDADAAKQKAYYNI